MPLKIWKSPDPRTAFAPKWMVPFHEETLERPDVNEALRQLILEKEPTLKQTIAPKPVSGIQDGLTSRWHGFNVFMWTESPAVAFQQFVKQAYLSYIQAIGAPRQRCFIQGWANVVRKGEKLAAHAHDQMPTSYVSGNYCVSTQASATIYHPPYHYDRAVRQKFCLRVENRPGMLTLFPSGIFHETTPYEGDDSRVTLAFDINVDDADALGVEGAQGQHVLFDDP